MIKGLVLGGLLLVALTPSARAEMPDYVLDHEYKNCVGGDEDPSRAAYCACVRDGMKHWDDSAYEELAMQMAAASTNPNAPPPAKIEELAKQCISQVMH
jgi:hypothetical protein